MTEGKILGSGPMKPRIYGLNMEPTPRLGDLVEPTNQRARHTRSPLCQHRLDLPRDHLGALAMLKESDEQWLRGEHPALIPTDQAIAGTIEFRASYNQQSNRFLILA